MESADIPLEQEKQNKKSAASSSVDVLLNHRNLKECILYTTNCWSNCDRFQLECRDTLKTSAQKQNS